MNKDLILKYNRELRCSMPIDYRGIMLHPVKFKDFEQYALFSSCLTFNPVYYNDPDACSLPRLYFITGALDEEECTDPVRKVYLVQLFGLLKLVLQDQLFKFEQINGKYFSLVVLRKDKPVVINAKRFDEMREIILIQNDTYYSDEYIHPDVLEYIQKQKDFKSKRNTRGVFETVEDKVEALMIEFANADEKFVDEMSIRRVQRIIDKIVDREMYNAQITGAMSGMVKFREDPVNWIATKPKQSDFDKYLKELK